jgi:hypothetical protein
MMRAQCMTSEDSAALSCIKLSINQQILRPGRHVRRIRANRWWDVRRRKRKEAKATRFAKFAARGRCALEARAEMFEATSSYRPWLDQAYSLHLKVGASAGFPTAIPGIPISRDNGANAAGVPCRARVLSGKPSWRWSGALDVAPIRCRRPRSQDRAAETESTCHRQASP